MSGNNNVTVAIPGHSNWGVAWSYGLDNFQLDIVGFLAVLGEGAVLANAQVSALSRLFFLPRLLPAPQALIRTTRPTTLPPTHAKVTGIVSGNVKDHIHHVANVLLGREMKPFTVRCVEVRKKLTPYETTVVDTTLRGQKRRNTRNQKAGPPPVKAKATGPLAWVTMIGFVEAIALLACSIIFGDGMSILATILLSGLSTVIGISNKWTLKLPQRPKDKPNAPPGDVVIRYPNGSYLIVKCEESVARELYFAPEEIEYDIKSPTIYRFLSLLGTIMLMGGIIALANAKLQLQFAWAGAYVIINIAHWITAAVPQRMHWDLSCYEVKEEGLDNGPYNNNFTEALWKTVLLTKNINWVKTGEAAPQTPVWDAWLIEARDMAETCGHRVGFVSDLQDPVWEGELPEKDTYTIWNEPDPRKWNARDLWIKLNSEHQESEKRNAMPTVKAV